nr:MAG TPA: hypothetical protein [Bacteriophage sp.]
MMKSVSFTIKSNQSLRALLFRMVQNVINN